MASAIADTRLASAPQRVGGHRLLQRQSLDVLEHGPAPIRDLRPGFGRLLMRECRGRGGELRPERLDRRDDVVGHR